MAKKIKLNIHDDMRRSLVDAQAFERGERVDLRVTEIPSPPKPMKPEEIRKIRLTLNVSQARFAQYLCVIWRSAFRCSVLRPSCSPLSSKKSRWMCARCAKYRCM